MTGISGNDSVVDTRLGWTSPTIVLKEHVLKEDTIYLVELTGVRGNHSAITQYRLRTTSRPHSGSCSVA